jgi:hypothetical protein
MAVLTVVLGFAPDAVSLTIWNEVGDAGELPGIAQITTGSGPLTQINGALVGSGSPRVDMFAISISAPAGFSATTVGTSGTLVDPQLFLFDSLGQGVYANDDSGGTLQPTLPLPAGTGPTTPGIYYLAISSFDNDPQDALNQLIFASTPFTGVFGPNGGVGSINNWSIQGSEGSYSILLTGADPVGSDLAPVPEPGTLVLFGTALAGMGWARRRFFPS